MGFHASIAWKHRFDPCWGAKIPHVVWCGQKIKGNIYTDADTQGEMLPNDKAEKEGVCLKAKGLQGLLLADSPPEPLEGTNPPVPLISDF